MKSSFFLITSFALVCWLALTTESRACQGNNSMSVVELTDGSSLEGLLKSADGEAVTLTVGEQDKVLETDAISAIRFSEKPEAEAESAIKVSLVDGSSLVCDSFTVSNRKLNAISKCECEFNIDTRLIDSVQMVTGDNSFQQKWIKTVAKTRESDALVVNRNQKLQMVEGIVSKVTEKSVTFTVGDRTADVNRDRISGLLFYRRYTEGPATTNFLVELMDGSTIRSQSLTVQGSSVEVLSTCGARLVVEPEALSGIDFQEGRAVWLTDLDPSGNSWTPLLASSKVLAKLKLFSLARINKSYGGKPLALLKRNEETDALVRQEFPHGFAIKGGGKLSFVLAKQYQRLTGVVGFDPDANSTGVVKFNLQIDGVTRLEEVLDASEMDRPFEIDVDIADASRVVFNVDYHDRRSVGDILHAVDMKLHR